MPVPGSIPTPHRLRSRLALSLFVLIVLLPVAFARGPEQPLRIPLENFGFQPLSAQFLLNGSSMLTLHYVDDTHLLLTFVAHRLIPRLPDEPTDDQDRVVDAFLLELPNGKVLARTSWHLHDHAQYLWSLGHGHFMLRIRDTLTTFAPLANIATPDPFLQHSFLSSGDRRFAALLLSPDDDLLIIETVRRTPPEEKPKTPLFGPTPTQAPKLIERDPVQINFYRIHPSDGGGSVPVSFAGAVKSPSTGDVPATTAGYLAVVNQGRPHWAFDFHSYAGKTAELSPFDSSCSPAPIFVSHSEFIAFGCRNGQTMQQIGAFNMRGEEMWEQGLFGDYTAPVLAYAPVGGRFALSRVMLRSSAIPDQPISADEIASQTVVVYQTGTGKQLLHADCSPVERASQNFTLSPNGLSLAVIHADAIELYNLPPLTPKDQSDLQLARSLAPPDTDLPVYFTQPSSSATKEDSSATRSARSTLPEKSNPQPLAPQPAAANQTAASGSEDPKPTLNAPSTPAAQSGDTQPGEHRTPPTLYTLPTDKAPANPKDSPQ
jgi:hypothetical protein